MDSDKALQSFREFTGCTDENGARRVLAKCDWNLERAIDCFFSGRNWEGEEEEEEVVWEDGQQPMSSSQSTRRRLSHFANSPWTTTQPSHATNGNRRQAEEGTAHRRTAKLNDSVQIIDEDNDVQMGEESSINGATKGVKNSSTDASAFFDDVRAPIAPVQGVLVNQSFRDTYRNRERLLNPVFEQYRQDQQQTSSSSSFSTVSGWTLHRANANGGGTSASNRLTDLDDQALSRPSSRVPLAPRTVDAHNDNDDRPAQSQHRKALQLLFRPPVELMFQGDWDQALQAARQKGIWLLVNVQEASEFACAVLNRDIWSAETVREVVRSNFLFWQVYRDSSDGARISGYYSLSSFPAIFIVDPRTGEEVDGRLKTSDPVSFLDSLTSFLDQNPTFDARDRFIREQTLVTHLETGSPPSPKNRVVTPTKKRKKPGDNSETGIELENGGRRQKAKTQMEEEEEQMMNKQAKKIKRVVTITGEDDDVISDRRSFSFSHVAATTQNACSLDANEWRHWLLNNSDSSKNKPTPVDGKTPPPVAQILFRLPDGRTERVRMPLRAPLSALFSFLSSMGFAPANHQLVLDYPRREFSLNPRSRRLSLESAGFGGQEVVHVDRIAP